MKLFKLLSLNCVIILFQFSVDAQSADVQKIISFNNLIRNTLNSFSAEVIQFNNQAITGSDLNALKTAYNQIKQNAQSNLTKIKNQSVPVDDSALKNETLMIFKRFIDKISYIEPLFNKKSLTDLNTIMLNICLQNQNFGAETNLIVKNYNTTFKKTALKYGLKTEEETKKLQAAEQYNSSMDYLNKNHLLYIKTIIGYNKTMEAINSHDTGKIRNSRLWFSKYLDTLIKSANVIKRTDDSILNPQCISLIKSTKNLCQNEISQIQSLFAKGLKTDADVKKINDLTKTISNTFINNQKIYDKQLIEFNKRAYQKFKSG